jgi:serine/threonine-protein phosphatase 2A activator
LVGFSEVLKILEEIIKETPPSEQPQRFGNKAYQTWYAKVEEKYDDLISKIVDKGKHPDLDKEIKNYFLDCFGSCKRIDYGTGHELNFICILLILFATGYYKEEDFPAVVHHVFFPYILLVRNLQITYKLEPAGAHGVWGLDEYHFLPFLFGASELINHEEIKPMSIHDDKIITSYSDEYMYISCIKYVKQVKTGGSFAEHSPMLDTISNVPNWEKVAKGLVKMYVDEVLKKYVVMQHFYFGSVIRFE